jgi:hypothetical protein
VTQSCLVLEVSEYFPDHFKGNDRQNPEANREEAVDLSVTVFVPNG